MALRITLTTPPPRIHKILISTMAGHRQRHLFRTTRGRTHYIRLHRRKTTASALHQPNHNVDDLRPCLARHNRLFLRRYLFPAMTLSSYSPSSAPQTPHIRDL